MKWLEVSLDRDIVFLLFMNGCVVAALLQMGAIEFKDYVRKQKDQVTHFLYVVKLGSWSWSRSNN